ncbi:hypothetical protein CYMTET_33828 [Cymbomonas tetramitiformis]|uniref:Uncharacterized protein n=1 Tax=Cymbomonas tetramitiformis TaxID=36881 RepID=A0AAE0KPG1_9CHLO|nr:hypothetical protein CYMTET_34968 [Cymbomonas tetramitiformis]KAK3257071.1 hypothetical protein CYMTET_33828 [Cymbomonas tetramitiformis]
MRVRETPCGGRVASPHHKSAEKEPRAAQVFISTAQAALRAQTMFARKQGEVLLTTCIGDDNTSIWLCTPYASLPFVERAWVATQAGLGDYTADISASSATRAGYRHDAQGTKANDPQRTIQVVGGAKGKGAARNAPPAGQGLFTIIPYSHDHPQ